MDELLELTTKQMECFKDLQKAYKACIKSKINFINRYGNLCAYDGNLICGFGDYQVHAAGVHEIHVLDVPGSVNKLEIPNEWTDDDIQHFYGLTRKGYELIRNK